jgi:hypothetical protein
VTKIEKIECALSDFICEGGGNADTIRRYARRIARIKDPAPKDEPFRCKGCDRPEEDCSADPCPDVIEDRSAVHEPNKSVDEPDAT